MLINLFLIFTILLTVAFLAFFAVIIVYFASALFVWPPSIPTDKKSRRAVVNFIKARYKADSEIKIVDLGSGYGHLVKDISKNFSHASITGVELLRVPYLYSKFIFQRNKRIKIIKGDIYDHDISGYDAMVFFLRKDHKMDTKVASQAKKGAIIVSNNFPLKTYEPAEIKQIKDVFGQRVIYFYQV